MSSETVKTERDTTHELSVRIEVGSLNADKVTGVGYYTASLIESMSCLPRTKVDVFNLGAKKAPLSTYLDITPIHAAYSVPSLSRRLYRKLFQYVIAPPCDATLPPVDVTIFPDFALWPTIHSTLSGVVVHDLTFIKYPQYMRSRSFGPISLPVTTWYLASAVPKSVRRADFILTVSESIKSELIEIFGVDEKKILVTTISPREDFKLQSESLCPKDVLCKKYNIQTSDYILSVGTLEPRKNHLALLNAYLQLPTDARSRYTLVSWRSRMGLRRDS
jgi:alpha-1,3-rhamnosyl/mannosyltransferase